MPANTRKARLPSYFEDDTGPHASRGMARTQSSAYGVDERGALGITVDPDMTHRGYKWKETDKYVPTHATHVHHPSTTTVEKESPAVHHAKTEHPTSKKAIREMIKKLEEEKSAKLKDSDTLLKDYKGAHHKTIESLLTHRNKCIQIRDEADEKFLNKHEDQFKENSAAYAKKIPLPHQSLKKERVIFVHSKTYTFKELDDLAKKLQEIVDEHGVHDKVLPCPRPIPVTGKAHEYYIFSIIKFLAREKYRVVEALLSEDRKSKEDAMSEWRRDFVQNSHQITHIKKKITELKQTLVSIRNAKQKKQKKRERKPREPWNLPDKDSLPRQTPLRGA